jgi:hypothetical protein
VRTFDPLPPGVTLEQFLNGTAEERVSLFDRLAPVLLSNVVRSRIEKAFALALLAYLCRPGFEQQATLLAQYHSVIPESILWLGAMQGAAHFSDTLAAGDGLGWRVARDLFEPSDIFSAPTCDIALPELRVLARGRNATKMIKGLARTRLDVELLPRVSTFVRTTQEELPEQTALRLESPGQEIGSRSIQQDRTYVASELVQDAERALKSLSLFLRNARGHTRDERPANRKRRR